jgi:AcrR family transcriptional regulator
MNDAAHRRAQILAAADRLLRHYGPQKTTVADVAREAGIGVGSVYLEFSSKDALLEELSRSRYGRILSAMHAAAEAEGRSFRERFAGVLDARAEAYFMLADEGAHACDLVHCMTGAGKEAAGRFVDAQRALLADLLTRGAAAGELTPLAPDASDETARAVLCAYESFTPPSLTRKGREEATREMSALHELVLFGLLRRDGGARPSGGGCGCPDASRDTSKRAGSG